MRTRYKKIGTIKDKIAENERRQNDCRNGAHARRKLLFCKHKQAPERTHPQCDQSSPQQGKIQTYDVQKSMVVISVTPQRHPQTLDKDETDDQFDQGGKQRDRRKIQDKHQGGTGSDAQAGRMFPFHLCVKLAHIPRKGRAEREPNGKRHRPVKITKREREHSAVAWLPENDKAERFKQPAEKRHRRGKQKIFADKLKGPLFRQRSFPHRNIISRPPALVNPRKVKTTSELVVCTDPKRVNYQPTR